MKRFLMISLSLFSLPLGAQDKEAKPYFNDRERGWFWYEKKEVEDVEEKKKELPKQKVEPIPAASAKETLKKQGEEVEEALAAATLNPTPENVQKYVMLSQMLNAKASLVADKFQQFLWSNPEFDMNVKNPISVNGRIAKSNLDKISIDKKFQEISKKVGFLFFFRGDCPHCQKFAPILQMTAADYALEVVPISLDGLSLPEYPNPSSAYSLAVELNVLEVPAVFMINPKTDKREPVSFGETDYETLKLKIINAYEIMKEKKGV